MSLVISLLLLALSFLYNFVSTLNQDLVTGLSVVSLRGDYLRNIVPPGRMESHRSLLGILVESVKIVEKNNSKNISLIALCTMQ